MQQLCRGPNVLKDVRSRFWIVFDCSMLLAFVALQDWPITGVPLHEWLGAALAACVVTHLVLHWRWVETQFRTHRAAYALNLALFLSVCAAIVSGFAISKVVLPLHPSPEDYLKWHKIHETSSNIALFCAALHLGLNWNRLFGRRPRWRLRFSAATIAIAAVVVTLAVYGVDRIMARPDITMITPDGRRIEHAAPPDNIAQLRRDTILPSKRGLPKFFLASGVVGVVAVVGRKVLRLRL